MKDPKLCLTTFEIKLHANLDQDTIYRSYYNTPYNVRYDMYDVNKNVSCKVSDNESKFDIKK